jgi:F420H(2)-dependent quinone reductase
MSTQGARGHLLFAVWNRSGNRVVSWLLRSPLHRPFSRRLALITVTGARSGRTYTIPVGYRREGANVTIPVLWPDRKRWWRNLREGAPVTLRLAGESYRGRAIVRDTSDKQLTVEVVLNDDAH